MLAATQVPIAAVQQCSDTASRRYLSFSSENQRHSMTLQQVILKVKRWWKFIHDIWETCSFLRKLFKKSNHLLPNWFKHFTYWDIIVRFCMYQSGCNLKKCVCCKCVIERTHRVWIWKNDIDQVIYDEEISQLWTDVKKHVKRC